MKTIQMVIAAALIATSGVAAAGGNVADGKTKSTTCAACHGADGNSTIAANPRLAGQHADYLVQAMKDYKSGARNNPIMAGLVAPLTEQDMEDLAAYFAAQSGLKTVVD